MIRHCTRLRAALGLAAPSHNRGSSPPRPSAQMAEWGKAHQADGKVRMLADPQADLAKQLGVEIDLSKALGNVRCKRFSAIVQDGVIQHMNVEADGTGLSCSLADPLIKQLA